MSNKLNISIGVDIENIDRFQKYIEPLNKNLINRIFTKQEQNYCFSTDNPASHLAVRFAAKEAIIKALYGMGLEKIKYSDMEIIKNDVGVPAVNFINNDYKDYLVKISLSHSANNAVAFVIISGV